MGGLHLRPSEYFHYVALLVGDGLAGDRSTDFWTFRVDHQGYELRRRANVIYYLAHPLRRAVGCVHAYDVHASKKELAQELLVAS